MLKASHDSIISVTCSKTCKKRKERILLLRKIPSRKKIWYTITRMSLCTVPIFKSRNFNTSKKKGGKKERGGAEGGKKEGRGGGREKKK